MQLTDSSSDEGEHEGRMSGYVWWNVRYQLHTSGGCDRMSTLVHP